MTKDDNEHAKQNAAAWLESIAEMVGRLDSESDRVREKASEEIQESPLSVEVRGGWHVPGLDAESPYEYSILLSAGGPALRIIGDLGEHCEPETATMQWQDWYTSWTNYDTSEYNSALLAFVSQFYFGE